MKVYVIIEVTTYNERKVIGVCSSKEKAEATMNALNYCYDDAYAYEMKECEIDEISEVATDKLMDVIKEYERPKTLLEKLEKAL